MAHSQWCSLLLKEPYFSYICSDAFSVDSQLFNDYANNVISAITYGHIIAGMEPGKQAEALEILQGLPQYAVTGEFLSLCAFKPVAFPKYCISDNYDSMTAEELAVNIMYPFWSRMGGSFETDFAKNGNLKKCLLLLSSRLQNM